MRMTDAGGGQPEPTRNAQRTAVWSEVNFTLRSTSTVAGSRITTKLVARGTPHTWLGLQPGAPKSGMPSTDFLVGLVASGPRSGLALTVSSFSFIRVSPVSGWATQPVTCCPTVSASLIASANASRLVIEPPVTAVTPANASSPPGPLLTALPKNAESMRVLRSRTSPWPTSSRALGSLSAASSLLRMLSTASFFGWITSSSRSASEGLISVASAVHVATGSVLTTEKRVVLEFVVTTLLTWVLTASAIRGRMTRA